MSFYQDDVVLIITIAIQSILPISIAYVCFIFILLFLAETAMTTYFSGSEFVCF